MSSHVVRLTEQLDDQRAMGRWLRAPLDFERTQAMEGRIRWDLVGADASIDSAFTAAADPDGLPRVPFARG